MARRAGTGKRLWVPAEDYTVIDLETTGLSSQDNEIIEFGAVSVRKHVIVDSFSRFVKPELPIPPFITDLTGISNAMVADALPLAEVLPEFLDFVGGDILLGHNVTFDIAFVHDSCMRLWDTPFSNDYLDTLAIARKLYPQERHNRLCDLEARFGLHNEHAHRALSDVILTKQCYDIMRERLPIMQEK